MRTFGDMGPGWRIAAALYVFINLGGAVIAIAMGEPMHAVGHAVFLVAGFGAYSIWRGRSKPEEQQPAITQPDAQLQYLQESVDAIAVEVERIGEAQRFSEKLRAKPDERPPANEPPKKP